MRKPKVLYVIDEVTGCWNWIGSKNAKGYGFIRRNGKTHKAHRYFYIALKGDIPAGLQLDHTCRNTSCVNPEHLEPVTNAENTRRSSRAKLTKQQAEEIRRRYASEQVSRADLARDFGVGIGAIGSLLDGRSWVAP